MQVLISMQEAQVQVLILLITGLGLFFALLLELLNLYKKWSIHQIRGPVSIIWLLGWQLWGGNAPAGLQTRLIAGLWVLWVSPLLFPASLSQKSVPRNPFPSQPCRAGHVPVPLHWAMKELRFLTSSRLNQHKRDGNFIPFYMQAQRHLGVSAKSRCVHYLLAVRQNHASENATK